MCVCVQVLGLVLVRHFMKYLFTEQELEILDDKMPELLKRKKQDATHRKDEMVNHQRELDIEVIRSFHCVHACVRTCVRVTPYIGINLYLFVRCLHPVLNIMSLFYYCKMRLGSFIRC